MCSCTCSTPALFVITGGQAPRKHPCSEGCPGLGAPRRKRAPKPCGDIRLASSKWFPVSVACVRARGANVPGLDGPGGKPIQAAGDMLPKSGKKSSYSSSFPVDNQRSNRLQIEWFQILRCRRVTPDTCQDISQWLTSVPVTQRPCHSPAALAEDSTNCCNYFSKRWLQLAIAAQHCSRQKKSAGRCLANKQAHPFL